VLGFKIQSEVITDKDIADTVWEQPETVVIVEMKYSATMKKSTRKATTYPTLTIPTNY
jgi:hypothetical protein